jgi:hypothetical protein
MSKGVKDNNNRYVKNENGVSKIMKLNNTERDYLYMLNSNLQYNVDHNFKILKGRYNELEKIIYISFPDEQIV